MTGQSKSLASLSSTLLARKGSARPAMRPQGFGGFGMMPGVQDDLGWNDMGEPEPVQPVVVQAAPVALPQAAASIEAPVPPVLMQRVALAEELAVPVAIEPQADDAVAVAQIAPAKDVTPVDVSRPVSVATAMRIRRETRTKHKAQARSAFTLRLDTDRHLKLRLASALSGRSAQALVTEALDAFLENMPEVERLIDQLPARAGN